MEGHQGSDSELQIKIAEEKKLIMQKETTKAEMFIIDEKLSQIRDRIAIRNNELNSRKRKLKEVKQSADKLQEEQKDQSKEIEQKVDTRYKIEKDIKQKLLRLVSRPDTDIDPNELFYFDGQKLEVKSNTVVHTVKIKLVRPNLISKKIKNTKIIPKEATFRINKKMTFNDVKGYACEH